MNAIKLIRKREANYTGRNVTRLYNVVNPIRNGEARIDTYAVKTGTKAQGLVIKKVARYYTDRNRYWVKDVLRNNFTNELMINWCEQSWGRKHQAVWTDVDAYQGSWGCCDMGDGEQVWLYAQYLNDFSGTKYERCAYPLTEDGYPPYMHFLRYAQCWNISHAVDCLVRDRLWHLITPTFTRSLVKDSHLCRYFRSAYPEIKKGYNIAAIRRAARTGESLADAAFAIHWESVANLKHIPKEIPRKEFGRWATRHDVRIDDYKTYLADLATLEIPVDAYGYMFPTDWKKRFDDVHDAAHELRERRYQAQMRKEAAKARRERKERLARWKLIKAFADTLDGIRMGRYTIRIPKTKTDLQREGKAMRNCVGTYWRTMTEGRAFLCFLYKDGKPFVDAEINPATLGVVQVREVDNRDAGKDARKVVGKIANMVKEHISRKAA